MALPYQLAHPLILHHCLRSKLRGNALFLIVSGRRQQVHLFIKEAVK
jgi:hypothetical protein